VGPYAEYKSFEWISQAMGGAMSLTGEPEGPPMRCTAGLRDSGSRLHCAIGILAALIQRQATGLGQQVEVAQQDSVVNLIRVNLRDHYAKGVAGPRRGNRVYGTAPCNLYRCASGGPNDYIYIHCATPEMWRGLMRIVGRPEYGDAPRFADRQGRYQYVEEMDRIIEAWTEKHTKHEAMEILAGAGVPCGAVLDTGEVLSNPHRIERGMMVPLQHPTRGAFTIRGNPIHLSESPTTLTPAPLLGAHNAEVYAALLGYTAADLAALERAGVI
jgi:formyl-CoA transferase